MYLYLHRDEAARGTKRAGTLAVGMGQKDFWLWFRSEPETPVPRCPQRRPGPGDSGSGSLNQSRREI